MRQMIGIALFSLFLVHLQGLESIELHYHTANFKEIEWDQINRLAIDQVSLRMFLDLPKEGGLYFRNQNFRLIEDRVTERFIPPLKQKKKPLIVGWLIARKYNWIKQKEWFDMAWSSGQRRVVEKIDLFNPDAVDAVVCTFADLAGAGVDGVLIQDDLMIRSIEGFSNWGKAAYTVQTGLPVDTDQMQIPGTPEHQNWNRVKLNQVNQIVRRIVTACKTVNPKCRVAMNVYYETPLQPDNAETWYAHNLAELMQTGLDELVLMAYHRQMAKEWKLELASPLFRERFGSMLSRAQRICNERLRVKLQIRDWENGSLIPVNELLDLLSLAEPAIKKISLTPIRPGDLEWVESLLNRLKRSSV